MYIEWEIQNPHNKLLFALNQVEALWEERERVFQKEELRARWSAHTNTTHPTMEVPKDQIATLLEHGLYNSAQMLVIFLFCSIRISKFDSPPKMVAFWFYDFWVGALIRSFCVEQGCFLVSSPAVNAESAPHLKTESLVCANFLFFFSFKF